MESKLNLAKLKAYPDKEQARRAMMVMAKAAEKMERFGDMCQIMRELVKFVAMQRKELTSAERVLVGVAFKNTVGQLRGAHRMVWTSDQFSAAANHYKNHIEAQLTTFCQTSLDLFAMVNKASGLSTESRVFALKLQADFQRYLTEISLEEGAEASPASQRALDLYQHAMQLAESKLEATDPMRLGVAINYAVCCQVVFKDTKQACQLAKTAFNQSIAKLDEVEDDQYKDSTLLMQMLRDNLTLWTADT